MLWSLLPGPPVVCTEMPTCLQTLPLSGQLAHVGEYTFYTLSSRVCHFSPDWGLSRAKTLGNSDSVQFAHCYSRLQNLVIPLKAHISILFDVRTAYVIQQLNKCDQMSHWSYKPKLICLTIFTSSYVLFTALCSWMSFPAFSSLTFICSCGIVARSVSTLDGLLSLTYSLVNFKFYQFSQS